MSNPYEPNAGSSAHPDVERKSAGRIARVSFKRTAPRSDGKLELEAGESLLHVVRTLEDGFPTMVSEAESSDRIGSGRGSVMQRTSTKLSLFRYAKAA
jgi:hypothetical protein